MCTFIQTVNIPGPPFPALSYHISIVLPLDDPTIAVEVPTPESYPREVPDLATPPGANFQISKGGVGAY